MCLCIPQWGPEGEEGHEWCRIDVNVYSEDLVFSNKDFREQTQKMIGVDPRRQFAASNVCRAWYDWHTHARTARVCVCVCVGVCVCVDFHV